MNNACNTTRVPDIGSGAHRARRAQPDRHALVIDHEADYGLVTADVLSDQFAVRMTSSAQMAFGLLASRRHALVVIEYTFPNALELVRHIRTGWPAIGVVMLSREPLLARYVAACFTADVDDYLQSPFHPSELAARVARMLRRADSNPEGNSDVSGTREPAAGATDSPTTHHRIIHSNIW